MIMTRCLQTVRAVISDLRHVSFSLTLLHQLRLVVWNGPMGVFENPTLAAGTLAVAEALNQMLSQSSVVEIQLQQLTRWDLATR